MCHASVRYARVGTQVRNLVVWSFLFSTVYRVRYTRAGTGTEHCCFGHTQVRTRVPNLVVLVILQYAPGYQTWLIWSYSRMCPGTKSGCFGHAGVGSRVPPECTNMPTRNRFFCTIHTKIPTLRFFFFFFGLSRSAAPFSLFYVSSC